MLKQSLCVSKFLSGIFNEQLIVWLSKYATVDTETENMFWFTKVLKWVEIRSSYSKFYKKQNALSPFVWTNRNRRQVHLTLSHDQKQTEYVHANDKLWTCVMCACLAQTFQSALIFIFVKMCVPRFLRICEQRLIIGKVID